MADIIHTISASTQLRVDAAATDATRIGSTYSVQASNITACTMGKFTAQAHETTGVAATHSDGVYMSQHWRCFHQLKVLHMGTKRMRLDSGVDVTAHNAIVSRC